MHSITVSSIVFACVFGSAMCLMFLNRILPKHWQSPESKDVVKLGMGLLATLSALVLGLLIASAKGSYDTQNNAVKELSAQIILLDRVLDRYGQETREARALLRGGVAASLERIWPEAGTQATSLKPGEARVAMEAMYDKIAALEPKTDAQRALRSRAMDITIELTQGRLRLFTRQDSSLPLPFLVVLVCWLTILFAGYGFLAPCNATVSAVLFVCALSVAGAIFLLLELDSPFAGIMRVSSAPVQNALTTLDGG